MIQWPENLPQQFERQGFSDEFNDLVVRSNLGGGKGKTRELARMGEPAPISGNMLMTDEQWMSFKRWYKEELKGGVLTFHILEPRLDSEEKILRVYFSQAPKAVPIGYNFNRVNLSLTKHGDV